jgi:hypothetical protein
MTDVDYLIREQYRCFRCGKPLNGTTPFNVHHRLFKGSGGGDECTNRIVLCGFGNNLMDANGAEWCHGWVHHHKKEAMASGWAISRHSKADPAEISVLHHERGFVLLTPDFTYGEAA